MAGYFDALNAYLPNQTQDPLLQAMGRGRLASLDPQFDPAAQFSPEQLRQLETNLPPSQPPGPMDLGARMPVTAVSRTQVPQAAIDGYKDLETELAKKVDAAMRQQAEGIKRQQSERDKYANAESKLDFSPLAAYFDSNVEGSKLLQGYKPPESADEKRVKLAALDQAIQKSKEGLSDKEIDSMKAQLTNSIYKKQIDAMKQSGREGRFDEAQLYKKERDIGVDLEKDVYDPLYTDQRNFDSLEANLRSGDSQKISGVLSIFSRLVSGQKGVLTDKDIALVLPRNYQADVAKMEAYFSANPSAAMDPQYTQKLEEMLATARQAAAKAYMDKAEQKRQAYKARRSFGEVFAPGGSGDVLFDQAKQRILSSSVGAAGSPAKKTPPPGLSKEQFKQWKAQNP